MEALIITNNELSKEQEIELKNNWGICNIWELGIITKSTWENTPPEIEKNELEIYFRLIINEMKKFDFIILIGELTTYTTIIDAAKHQGIKILILITQSKNIKMISPNGKIVKRPISKHIKFKEL